MYGVRNLLKAKKFSDFSLVRQNKPMGELCVHEEQKLTIIGCDLFFGLCSCVNIMGLYLSEDCRLETAQPRHLSLYNRNFTVGHG